jgi:hypothetical protein
MEYVKDTTGFVRQYYEGEICVSQEFRACEPVEYSTSDGILITPPKDENYQSFDMVQPNNGEKELDYYVIMIWGCVDPQLYGPFSTPEKQHTEISRLKEKHGEDSHTFFMMEVNKGSKITI